MRRALGVFRHAEAVEVAAERAVSELYRRGARFAIVGGLAVAHHGYRRTTMDIDVITRDKNKVRGRPLGIPGVGYEVDGIPVDVIFFTAKENFLAVEIDNAMFSAGGNPPMISLRGLVYLKLKAGRAKDDADIVELTKVNAMSDVVEWIAFNAPQYQRKLSALRQRAKAEETA